MMLEQKLLHWIVCYMHEWKRCGSAKPCKNKKCKHNKNDHRRTTKNKIPVIYECEFFNCDCDGYIE